LLKALQKKAKQGVNVKARRKMRGVRARSPLLDGVVWDLGEVDDEGEEARDDHHVAVDGVVGEAPPAGDGAEPEPVDGVCDGAVARDS
jgi:hypothetical protein